ncbi:hypothetical protein GLOIN_2v1764020 [Rhizophagus irregularis DAOM 181602=DAOM 197198]|nr:hypothetical protein GLOIN_2v1764020 [Rhizophagus irregularis DAOM 181602=DAOM 197198]
MKSIKHQIFYFPEAIVRLESLCELKCNTSIDTSYFYGLSQYCQYIQRLIIINMDTKSNHGIVKLIEVQKNLKHFEWQDNFYEELFMNDDCYENVLLALEKKAEKQLEKLKIQVYHELEILNIGCNRLNLISSIIKNSGGCLKKLLFRPYNVIGSEYDSFNENSLKFIQNLEEFLEKWRGRHALTIFTVGSIYMGENYTKLIDKYKSDGVIKDFKYFRYMDSLSYYF